MAVIQVDLDGVLADFMWGFTQRAADMGFMPGPVSSTESKFWDDYHGLTPEQVDRVWAFVKKSPLFWRALPCLVDTPTMFHLNRMQAAHDVFFATARIGVEVKRQTAAWLKMHGIEEPTVVVTPRKALIAEAARSDYSIEDNWHNAVCIADVCPGSVVLDRLYNRLDAADTPPVMRVGTVAQFLQIIDKETM